MSQRFYRVSSRLYDFVYLQVCGLRIRIRARVGYPFIVKFLVALRCTPHAARSTEYFSVEKKWTKATIITIYPLKNEANKSNVSLLQSFNFETKTLVL